MSNGLTDPSMMDRVAQQNLMMQAGLVGNQQSLQMVPNSSANQLQPQSPMNLNMMNNMGMNMNLNGTNKFYNYDFELYFHHFYNDIYRFKQ